jgi:membrane protease YdiL (CAAX protease family)
LSQETLSAPDALYTAPAVRPIWQIVFLATETLVIGVSLLMLRLVVGREWKRKIAFRTPGFTHTLLALASLPALVLLVNKTFFILHEDLHLPSFIQQVTSMFEAWPWPVAVLIIGVGPGVGEELWCRGFLGRGLVGRYGVILGVIFSSFFFGLIHLDPAQGLMAMAMGFWLHFVYLTSRSILLPMLLHFLNNTAAVVMGRIPGLAAFDEKLPQLPWPVFLVAGLLLTCVAVALIQSRARLVGLDGGASPWRPDFPGVEYPPDDSGARVFRPLPSLTALAAAAFSFLGLVFACLLVAV